LEEKEKAREQLVRSESLAAIGQLVAGAAHELNNPLACAISLLQTAIEEMETYKNGAPTDKDFIEDLHFARRELRRAGEIVTCLLDLSRQTQTYNEPVNITSVIRHALRILKTRFRNCPIRIIEDYQEQLPDISGNFANLGQVAINLIQNAFQEMEAEGGILFLSTGLDSDKTNVRFVCKDTGSGIPANLMGDIFKPFFTSKAVGQGTGLGLYLCHEIVSRHGGTIVAESPDSGGAQFTVHLPVAN
jgi:two-component system NtrC family sensor kinase